MGIYSNTARYSDDCTLDVVANESYNSTSGLGLALIESYQNDLALFESAIHSDMAEIAAVNEGAEVVNEGAKEIWSKLKEIFMKLLAKVKGIFKAFNAKISGVFSDSENLYKKYSPVISKNSNWKSFKAKVRPYKGGSNIVEEISAKGKYEFNSAYSFEPSASDKKIAGNITYNQIVSKDSDIDQEDILTAICERSLDKSLSANINGIEEIGKEFMDLLFDDEEVRDNWSTGDILHTYIGGLLKDANKNESVIKKCNDNMETTIERIIKQIDKESQNVSKILSNANLEKSPNQYPTTDVSVTGSSDGKTKGSATSVQRKVIVKNKDTIENIERLAGFWQRYANAEQAVINKLTSARLGAYKFAITQARRVFSSAAAYASVDHKNESYDFYAAIGEAVEYDTLTDLQAI